MHVICKIWKARKWFWAWASLTYSNTFYFTLDSGEGNCSLDFTQPLLMIINLIFVADVLMEEITCLILWQYNSIQSRRFN